jgi:VWFA-related protein
LIAQEIQHDVTITLKLIQVHVMDEEGRPVKDLTKEDFVLFDNGKEQIVTDFERYFLTEKEPEAKELLTDVAATEPADSGSSTSQMNRKFFLLIDLDRVSFPNIRRSKEMVLHFLDTQLHPTDEVGLFTVSKISGLRLHQYPTTDHSKAKDFIASFKSLGSGRPVGEGVSFVDEPIGSHSLTRRMGGREDAERTEQTETFEASNFPNLVNRLDATGTINVLFAIKKMAKALQYIPGNKYVIFLSEGYETSFARDWWFRDNFEEMAQILATSSVPVYAVNPNPGNNELGRNPAGDTALAYLSEVSGGKHFDDIRRYEDISEQIQTLTGNYYVLGYYISEAWDGKFHKIEVDVKREGCQVFAQSGYYSPVPFKKLSETEKMFQLIDLALGEGEYSHKVLDFPLMTLPTEIDGQSHAVLFAEAPLGEMAEIIGGGVKVITLLFDENSTIVESIRSEMDLNSVTAQKVNFFTAAPLEPGSYNCSLVIRNMETGAGAVASAPVFIPGPRDKDFQILPPLLFKEDRQAFFLKDYGFRRSQEKPDLFSLSDIFLVDSAHFVPYMGDTLPQNSYVWASIRCAIPSGMDSDIELSAALFDNSVLKEIPVSLEVIREEEEAGIKAAFVRFRIPEAETGEYTLIFKAKHLASGATSHIRRDYLIEDVDRKTAIREFLSIPIPEMKGNRAYR